MKRLSLNRDSITFRQSIIFSVILCILIPTVSTIIYFQFVKKGELESKAVAQIEEELRLLDLSFTDYFDDLIYLANYLQFDEDIKHVLRNNLYQKSSNLKNIDALTTVQISNSLESTIQLLPPFYFTLLLDNGYSYTNYSTLDFNPSNLFQLFNLENMTEINFYENRWFGIHPTYFLSQKENNPFLISFARKLKLNDYHSAYMLISINESQISKRIFEEFYQNKQEIMLVDSKGIIITSTNEKEVSKEFRFKQKVNYSTSNHSVVTYNDETYLLVSYPLSFDGYSIVSLVPYKEIIGDVSKFTRNVLLIQYCFFAIFLILLIILIRRLTKPIVKLTYITKEVEKGNLKVRSKFKGKGDIQFLGYSFDEMLDQIEEMIFQIKREEKEKRKAELEMLQAQINPHFLFNILNSIRLNNILNGDNETANLIHSLSLLLRMTITRNNEFISLREEVDIVNHYIKLMNFRYKGRVEVVNDLSSHSLLEEVPRFFLQPIIENAIIHGFGTKGGIIHITSYFSNHHLIIVIRDNGRGIDEVKLKDIRNILLNNDIKDKKKNKSSFTGIGLGNVYQRLFIIYGRAFQMEIDSQIQKGTEINIYIPRESGVLKSV
ncbi:sensor histidine kinase [Bacillus sp. 1P02SD]|uniref:sensor histidine kinase n=1 Tax=Bacillus sp. 1P02SD TaxID=3132264 RepID=UPI0039A38ED7